MNIHPLKSDIIERNMPRYFTNVMILITVIFMDLVTGMEFDLFVPSFPQLQSHFNLSAFWIEALLSVNFIGYCLSLFIVGNFSDRYGRKPVILLGLTTFIIGGIFCLSGNYYGFILIGRFFQGIGIAAPAILSFLIIADHYPLKKQQFFMAMLNASMNVAASVAPVIGSYITLYFQWRGNFIMLLLLGIIAFLMTLFFIPMYKFPDNKEAKPMGGYIALFQSKPLLLLMTTIVVMFVPYWIFVGVSPLLYMKNLHVSLHAFGFYQGILAFVFAIGSLFFGLILNRFSQKRMLSISLQIFIISLVCIGFVALINSTNPLLITLAMLIFVIGQIIPSAVLYPLCMNFVPQAKGRISAIIQGARLIFSALSLQIAGYFYDKSFQNIGIMITTFILMIIITQFYVMKNKKIMHTS